MSMEMFAQCGNESLTVEKLSDGSMAIVDNRTKSVHSLNATAALVWEACARGASVDEIRRAVELAAQSPVSEEIVLKALAELRKADLVESNAPNFAAEPDLGRRSVLRRVAAAGAVAVPVVLTLTAAEQKAYAFQSQSGTTTQQFIG